MVTQAIDGLQAELESIGLVFARHVITPKRRVMTAVYAASDLPDHDGGVCRGACLTSKALCRSITRSYIHQPTAQAIELVPMTSLTS